jgi:glycosyltransferase involved in cell wall biosynthesis
MKICFVALNIYPVLSEKNNLKIIGGAELQQLHIGQGLKGKGYKVYYITRDFGQPDGDNVNGLIILKTYKPKEGIFGLRFFFPRLCKIWKALKKSDADIYFLRSDTYLLGVLAFFCKKYRKKLVFGAAHDTNFIPDQYRMKTKYRIIKIRDKYLYLYGLKRVDSIIVQSKIQKKLLWDNFNLKSNVIRNFHPLEPVKLQASQRKYVLWVATIRAWKRPEQFINLARNFPQEQFIMIGGRDMKDGYLYDEINKKAKKLKNLQFFGFQPLSVTETYFDQCKVFVNTSKYEGFPNTFLQAWRRGIPVISYVDPDNAILSKRLGKVVRSEEDLQNALSEIISNPSRETNHIQDYFVRYHSSKTIDKYCSIFEQLFKD